MNPAETRDIELVPMKANGERLSYPLIIAREYLATWIHHSRDQAALDAGLLKKCTGTKEEKKP